MKVGVFNNVRGGKDRFMPYVPHDSGLELVELPYPPTEEAFAILGAEQCRGLIYYDDQKEGEEFYRTIADKGVKYVVTCSAGYDHFDLDLMKKYGIKGANVPKYSPNAVSEYTVMVVLALLRKLRVQFDHVRSHSYGIAGLQGRELRNMVVGIIGAGRIGYTTMQCLSGFKPKKILACDMYPNDAVRQYADYVPLEELYRRADVIIFHCAYTEENYHMVNDGTIAMMKKGVVLVNSARGPLFDTEAVLRGLNSGAIGALGLDVIEGEGALRQETDQSATVRAVVDALISHENVIYTNHTAFYTDEADRNMNEATVENLLQYEKTGRCDNEVVAP